MALIRIVAACVLLPGVVGCAGKQLRRTTPRHAETLAGIYEQQVLDNLAAFAVNSGATPSFAVPTSGTSGISHANTANGGLNFNPTTLTGASMGLNGTRTHTVNWVMRPINDPARLELMKCVFQYATRRCHKDGCSDCVTKLTRFFGGDLSPCTLPAGFFKVSEHPPLRVGDCCTKSGSACGVHVCVAADNFECLSRLTMAILDIATVSDDDLAKRLAAPSEPRIDVTETFIANIGGRQSLIKGTYEVPESEYYRIQRSGYSVEQLLQQGVLSLPGAGPADFPENKGQPLGIDPSTLRMSPAQSDPRRLPSARRFQGGTIDELESLIQSTNQ